MEDFKFGKEFLWTAVRNWPKQKSEFLLRLEFQKTSQKQVRQVVTGLTILLTSCESG